MFPLYYAVSGGQLGLEEGPDASLKENASARLATDLFNQHATTS